MNKTHSHGLKQTLKQSLKTILTVAAENPRTVCVFDLDSTLFNVSPRTQQILHEFAELHKPELKKVEILHTDWGLKEALVRAGYKFEESIELHTSLRDFWVERFFTNTYLHYDLPYRGAVPYVQRLHETGCEVHYLTGRDIARMGVGTLEVLKKWGFPVREGCLHLKPHRSMDDHVFKIDWVIDRFPLEKYSPEIAPVYFFENEPVNINALGKVRPDIHIIQLDTTHSRQEEVNVPVTKVSNFYFEEDN